MSKKTLILSGLILALLGIFFLSELFLPEFVAGKIKAEVEARFRGKIKVTEVAVKAKPALKLLLGRADLVSFKGTNLALGNLEAARLELVLGDVKIEALQSGQRKVSVLDQAKSVSGSMIITEEALNRFVAQQVNLPIKKPELNLKGGKLVLKGDITVLGRPIHTEITGNFKTEAGNTLVFLPKDLMVAGFKLPEYLKAELIRQIAFRMTLKNLPLDLRLSSVELKKGWIRVNLRK